MNIENLYQRGLSLEKLRAFLAVVRAGTVIAAAKGNDSTRSLMSRQIGELEKTLGLELFLRKGRSLILTDTGRELALITATYFEEFSSFVSRKTGGDQRLRVGAGASTLESVVFPRIQEIRKRFQNYEFDFVTNNTSKLISALRQGELDAAIVRAGDHSENLITIPCGKIEFALVGRIDFDSNLSNWSFRQFLDRVPLAMIHGEGRFVSNFRRLCSEIEVQPQISTRTESFAQIRQLLLAGFPGGFIPIPLTKDLLASEFHIIENSNLERLNRDLVLIIDARVAKMKDSLTQIVESFADIICVR